MALLATSQRNSSIGTEWPHLVFKRFALSCRSSKSVAPFQKRKVKWRGSTQCPRQTCPPSSLRPPVRWRAAHLLRFATEFKSLCPGTFPLRYGWLAEEWCCSSLTAHRPRHIARVPPSVKNRCGLTLRSSRPAPAWHLGREAFMLIIRLAAKAPRLHGRLSSNVRHHKLTPGMEWVRRA